MYLEWRKIDSVVDKGLGTVDWAYHESFDKDGFHFFNKFSEDFFLGNTCMCGI